MFVRPCDDFETAESQFVCLTAGGNVAQQTGELESGRKMFWENVSQQETATELQTEEAETLCVHDETCSSQPKQREIRDY